MTTLKERDNETFKAFRPTHPVRGGITCPECGGELSDRNDTILLSLPTKREVFCEECGQKGLAIA